jgi:hypothetical protein
MAGFSRAFPRTFPDFAHYFNFNLVLSGFYQAFFTEKSPGLFRDDLSEKSFFFAIF